eukprot:CAMPEP_0194288410 /NCGR_PEP_ID=MMETSP0169-20130528/36754_1 /TAXON_ID=218684 /ORGANISM="Corethron pennatum, Strain L29A3" /LENGTH=77 /DNA_ID=CAMNT_0039035401 /DNA_START=411 /DNA_END=644 /DNA_ORIENTATION=+
MDGVEIWNRKLEGKFPETKELKQRIRDIVRPEKDLGHSDVDKISSPPVVEFEGEDDVDDAAMDDEKAEEMRKYFGVQ